MRKLLMLALVAALTACTARTTDDGDLEISPATDRIGDWNGTLAAVSNSGVYGTARVRSAFAAAGASVAIAGAQPNATHPWHVHRGTCATGGSIVGDAGAYPPLQVGGNGEARAEATIAVGLDEEGQYHVNIHRSPSQMGQIVACGNLQH